MFIIGLLSCRNQRMFGFLMGTLQKFQKDSNHKSEQVVLTIVAIALKDCPYNGVVWLGEETS